VQKGLLAWLLVMAFNAQAQLVLDLNWVDRWEIFHRHWGWQAEAAAGHLRELVYVQA
jgi:hypothetical protein